MYSKILTAILDGIQTIPIMVEADVSNGMPMFDLVGYLSSEVREASKRVKTALHNCNISLPAKRITVNLSPASIRKNGTGFDLPIAVALMDALGLVEKKRCQTTFFAGELSLNGNILPINGILPMVSDAKEKGIKEFVVPVENIAEAKLVTGINIYAFYNLNDLIAFLNGKAYSCIDNNIEEKQSSSYQPDFSEVNGQHYLRRVCEVAAAGMHNMLMVGPPGAGKTMISERMATILPPLTEEEQLEISKIYSVCGLLYQKHTKITQRPFRNPHHTITSIGLTGGGVVPIPGEISLAHGGVLFLDELTEFQKQTLEMMRQPMEEHQIRLVRANNHVTYPARFLLLAAMNPCNCGYYPDTQKCRCTTGSLRKYHEKISQPLLDRIDICVEAPLIRYEELVGQQKNESSESIRKRVIACHNLQCKRYQNETFHHNSQIPSAKIKEYCPLNKEEHVYLECVFQKENLTARTYHKILRVARTIADLEQSERITRHHLIEAVCYRNIMQRFQGGV